MAISVKVLALLVISGWKLFSVTAQTEDVSSGQKTPLWIFAVVPIAIVLIIIAWRYRGT